MVSGVNMAVNLGGIKMRNPINTASGTFGFGWQLEGFYDVSMLGAITTKGTSAVPWEGLEDRGCRVIMQAAGHSIEEYRDAVRLIEELAPFASGVELNISCPNIARGGRLVGGTPEDASEVVRAVRPLVSRPLLVKMAPVRVPEIAKACEDAGADALSLINTINAMSIDIHTRRSRLSKPTGGLSGPAIHPIAVRMVWEAAQAVSIPINGIGGIATGADAAEMILAGATAVTIGTQNLPDPTAGPRILAELEQWAVEQNVSDINELVGAFEC